MQLILLKRIDFVVMLKELLLAQEFFRKGVSSGWCLFERTRKQ